MAGNGVMTFDIGDDTEVVTLVLHGGKGDSLTCLGISNGSGEHLLGRGSEK